jgi:hypothetical protein
MKRIAILAVAVLMVLSVASCTKTGANDSAARTGDAAAQQATLSPAMRLVLGAFRLEGTAQAISAEQAGELTTLWKAFRALSLSDTAVAQEVDALVKQIESTLTAGQRQEITAMQLSYADLAAISEERGIEMGVGAAGGRGNLTPEQVATAQALRAQSGGVAVGGGRGGGPGGGPGMMLYEGGIPGAGIVPPGAAAGAQSGSASAEQIATARARASARVPTALLDALIALLTERAGMAN